MSSSINKEYFEKYCLVLTDLLSREDKHNPAIKSIIRYVIREAVNHASDLPGYDNKLGAKVLSKNALSQIISKNTSDLIGEHVVPISIVNEILLNMTNPIKIVIEDTLRKFSLRAVITVDEDRILKSKNLTKNMPPNWDGEKIMARYVFCGIETEDISFKEAIKKS
jgi:hypothetical protein